MKYYSTKNRQQAFSFKEAVMQGLAADGGLFMPEYFPSQTKLVSNISQYSFAELSLEIIKPFIGMEISFNDLHRIINEAISFPALISRLAKNLFVLELHHGPTLAFKDFGARFMAKTMGFFTASENKSLNILVATSGDTGSAVANGFYDTTGINVYILYPSGKVSFIQEQQLTTLDKNITAIEIDGTFDDCQRLVKQAFLDKELNIKMNLSSANSINISRLLPQSFYYFEAYKQLKNMQEEFVFSVPSGNLGNLTAGIFAKRMGLPVKNFIAATNSNDVFTQYLLNGDFLPRKSTQTYSNAMDVGDPSNLVRIDKLYNYELNEMREEIYSFSFNDADTISSMKEVYEKFNYIIDPHGAVGYLAYKSFTGLDNSEKQTGIILETAHPAKFQDVVEKALNIKIDVPQRLAECLTKNKSTIKLSAEYKSLKEFLWSRNY